jgi:hypothetical protein
MADQLIYPLIRGFRHGFASITLKFQLDGGKTVQMFCKSINYGRTRSRGLVRGNHPDPIAKTRGENEYKASVEMALAEYRLLIAEIGAGYGDKVFDTIVTYGETGFETVTDVIQGCTIDDDDASNSQGPDPLMRKLDLAPLKILMAGVDDLEFPLTAPVP